MSFARTVAAALFALSATTGTAMTSDRIERVYDLPDTSAYKSGGAFLDLAIAIL